MLEKNKERGKTVTNKKNLSVLLEAVEILKNECLLEKGETMKILKYENKTISLAQMVEAIMFDIEMRTGNTQFMVTAQKMFC